MNLTCKKCGIVGLMRDMLYSRHTGNAYCRDEVGCAKRQKRSKKK